MNGSYHFKIRKVMGEPIAISGTVEERVIKAYGSLFELLDIIT